MVLAPRLVDRAAPSLYFGSTLVPLYAVIVIVKGTFTVAKEGWDVNWSAFAPPESALTSGNRVTKSAAAMANPATRSAWAGSNWVGRGAMSTFTQSPRQEFYI